MKKTHKAVAAMVPVILAGAAHAATISWSAGIDSSTVLPVAPGAGETLIEAANVGGVAITVNGMDFVSGNTGSILGNSNVITALGSGDSGAPGGGGNPFGASANFATVLDSHRWTGGTGAVALVFDGLTPGANYRLQLGMSDVRTCCSGRAYTFDDGGGSVSDSFTRGDNVHFTGTFTADATFQTVNITPGAGSTDPGISFYTLTVVPEPSSAALLALGSLFTLRRKR